MNKPQILLIVEDEVLTAMSLKSGLEDDGYEVMDLTSRPGEAMAAARDRKPDLALVNIKLYGHNDGIALAVELKAIGIPVLFISGQPNRAVAARSVAVGSLAKPYSVDDMVAAVTYLLARLAGDASQPRPKDLEVFDEDLPEAA
ncbi:response regulator [Phenylobacterium sp.]|uniref:response regulator n=1 Tax=Phenylobacterium sp. TaxID=1871053 RepID=UPI002720999D|nr:response regulator [Phenylobacterium sp.]MDO8801945.1 response regulator [Phenylobacterium sp.]